MILYLVSEGCLSTRHNETPVENWKKKKIKRACLMKLLHTWIWVEINHGENEWVHIALQICIKDAIYHILAKLHKSIQKIAKWAHAQYKGSKEFQKTNMKQMLALHFLMSYLNQSRLASVLRQTQNLTQPDWVLRAWLQMSNQHTRSTYLQISIFLWITEDKDTE